MLLMLNENRKPLQGEILVPRSKYHAHRALILASLAEGTSRITGLSDARHVQYTISLLRGLGVRMERSNDTLLVHGGRYHPVRDRVSAGSSGTTLYFMLGLAALADGPVTVTGQKYFQRRPIGPLVEALREMGVDLTPTAGCPPVHVRPCVPSGGRVRIDGTLSQWISALILLAPFASSRTVIEVTGEPNETSYIQLTIAMMRRFGLRVGVQDDWRRFTIEPRQEAVPQDITLPPDIGSAAFAVAAAALHPADVLLRGMDRLDGRADDHPEIRFLDTAREMGVPMSPDPAGGVRIRHDGITLRGTKVDCRDMPDMLPVLSTMAGLAQGESVFENIAHVRLKESDRVAAMLQLNKMGANLQVEGDVMRVAGVPGLRGRRLSSFNDHRVLMSLALAGTRATGETALTYPHAYRISYPTFFDDLTGIGLPMSIGPAPRPKSRRGDTDDRHASGSDVAPTLPDLVRRWARERPHDDAVVDPRSAPLSWQALDEEVDRAAAALVELGVEPGEPVACQLPNWTEFVVLSLATLRIGAVCCPLMPIFRRREIAFSLTRSKARVFVVAESFRNREHARETAEWLAAAETGDAGSLRHVVVVPTAANPAEWDGRIGAVRWHSWPQLVGQAQVDRRQLSDRAPAGQDIAQLLFTSGTTGEPKGVLHRHSVLDRAVRLQAERLSLGAGDVVYIPSPLPHQTGFLYGMWLAVTLGVPQVLQPTWDPREALRLVRTHGATFLQAATPFIADLLQLVEEGAPAPKSLRVVVATGTAVPRALAERAGRLLHASVCGAFGTTETCLGSLSAPDDAPEKVWGTDGRPMDGVQLRITDDEGAPVPAGHVGNFELRSDTCFVGYLDRPDLTAAAWTDDGWYRTGDLATIDTSGYLRIVGRVKDVINRGGEKVPVAEVEELLHSHPAVREAAVVAMPDSRLGERACAFLVLREGRHLGLQDIRDHLYRSHLTRTYWPERVEIVDSLPRNPAGKVQKFILRDQARALTSARPEERHA